MRRTIEFGYFVQPRSDGDPATTPMPSHRTMLTDAQTAEKLGFDAAWVPDHFYFERPTRLETFPDLWTLMTAIGVTTDRIKIGSMVIAAGFRHPALLAKMAGALQELTDGRLILGIGAGNQIHEHTAFDLGFDRRIGRFKEYLMILTKFLNGETVSFEGRHFTLREASLRTKVPKVPLWIAAGGEQMLGLTARYADGWNVAGGVGLDDVAYQQRLDGLTSALSTAGRGIDDIVVSLQTFVSVLPDAAAVRQAEEVLAMENKSTPEALQKRMAIGTPDQVAARFQRFVDLGVQHFVVIQNLNPDPQTYGDRVEMFAREVIPRINKS